MNHTSDHELVLCAGRNSEELAGKIAQSLGQPLFDVDLKTFASGELYARFKESVRGKDVFLIQSTGQGKTLSPNDALMELLLLIDAARGAAARSVIAVNPYFGYARQDKKSAPREPISARLVASLLETAGVDQMVTMELHSGQIQGFFKVPTEHLTSLTILSDYINTEFGLDSVIVAPDAGRAKLARKFSQKTGLPYALMEKHRPEHGTTEIGYVIGDVKGKKAIIIDDMIDSAGTICSASEAVIEAGAKEVHVLATHGVFSGPAFERLESSCIKSVVVLDTIEISADAPDKIKVISTADAFADSIKAIFQDGSVSSVFAGENQTF